MAKQYYYIPDPKEILPDGKPATINRKSSEQQKNRIESQESALIHSQIYTKVWDEFVLEMSTMQLDTAYVVFEGSCSVWVHPQYLIQGISERLCGCFQKILLR